MVKDLRKTFRARIKDHTRATILYDSMGSNAPELIGHDDKETAIIRWALDFGLQELEGRYILGQPEPDYVGKVIRNA